MTAPVSYRRSLGLFSGTMLVIGGIIGSGIFLNPAIVAQRVGTAGLTLGAWGLGAVVALIGAFIFAELGQRRPKAGGGYIYLREAFGPVYAFLYPWTLFLMTATGAIAAVAVTFASYGASLLGLPGAVEKPLASVAILLLTAVNILGVRPGAWTQNVFTVLKLAAITVLVFAAFFLSPLHPHICTACTAAVAPTSWGGGILAMGAALVPVLFAYGGWQQTNFVAEELREPERNMPRALVLGVIAVVVVYLAVNLAYLKALGADGLAASTAPAADTMEVYLGAAGRTLIAAGIVISTFGFLNLVILVTPRVYQATAADGLFFEGFARLHPEFRTPVLALLAQGVWAVILVWWGTYGQLLDYVVFADWIFFGSNAVALFVLRRKDLAAGTDARVTVRTPFHPWSTGIFIAAAVYVLVGTITSNPQNALIGAGFLAIGVPVCLYWRGRSRRV
ncbi:MAG: APC family permease [Gemmatimonadales bacterium]